MAPSSSSVRVALSSDQRGQKPDMSTPNLSLGGLDHYTPELRDRILEKLSAAHLNETAYQMLTPARLRSLIEIEAADATVVSFYMQLSPDRGVGGAWRTFFSSFREATLKPIQNRHHREEIRGELDRIGQALEAELPALGRGVAFFSSQKLGLWQQIAVSVSLPDRVWLNPKPYLRPLVRTRDEHDRFVLVLLSEKLSRFFISQIGQVEEMLEITTERPHALAEGGPKDWAEVTVTEPVKNEARVLAHAAELALMQFEGRYLLLSGSLELRKAVMQYLPKHIRQSVGGEFSVEIHAQPAAVAAAAEPAQRVVEAREEVAMIEKVIDLGPERSAWGDQPTLDALWEGRVMTLAVDDTFWKHGSHCRNCNAMRAGNMSKCPVCGSDAIEAIGDVVELAIEHALEERSALEIVRSSAARRLMASIGPMAALLRW
jgi:peptide subunit release factor 1 (eRF1)